TPTSSGPQRPRIGSSTLRSSVPRVLPSMTSRPSPRAANVLLKMLGEETVQEDPAADALAKAKELLGGVDSAID
ncbi:hypothetical protein, partial [Faecalibacterium prausnitzii]|uniref:hypothetical protein n=1 Tax=Faecalibacterium prausnitzii TaxID=853 RepID=UPI003F52B9F9